MRGAHAAGLGLSKEGETAIAERQFVKKFEAGSFVHSEGERITSLPLCSKGGFGSI